jgi:hypothetical protein
MPEGYEIERDEKKTIEAAAGPRPSTSESSEPSERPRTEPTSGPAHGSAPSTGGVKSAVASLRTAAAQTVAAAGADKSPLSKEGFPGLRTLLIIGLVVLVAAMVFSANLGMSESRGNVLVAFGKVFLAGYYALLHTGTGVAAVAAAALLLSRPAGRLDFAAARMLCAVSLVILTMQMDLPGGYLGLAVKSLLSLLLYWATVLLLFRRTIEETNVIAVMHLGFYLFLALGSWVARAVDLGIASATAVRS